jgi:chromosomal replication initiation ATPase DnaA
MAGPAQIKQAIIEAACKAYDLPADIVMKDRAGDILECRRLIIHLIRQNTNFSLRYIDEGFGYTAGSVSQYAVAFVDDKLMNDKKFKRLYEDIIESINKQFKK